MLLLFGYTTEKYVLCRLRKPKSKITKKADMQSNLIVLVGKFWIKQVYDDLDLELYRKSLKLRSIVHLKNKNKNTK